MRKVLIISPGFPPVNAADMHRVRHSLPHFAEFGWSAVTLAVEPRYDVRPADPLLVASLPADARVERVRALDQRRTRRLGLGSLALRSLWFYWRAGSRLLEREDFDLVYFSTTEFPLTILGAHWKRQFGIPYVIDMQDPWHSDYYRSRPRDERPPKYWFSYRLNKYLEPVAMRSVDALISVSEEYCANLKSRYSQLDSRPCAVIPFGGSALDFATLDRLHVANPVFDPNDGNTHVVYVGRGGHDLSVAMHAILGALADGLASRPDLFDRVRVHLVGTQYTRTEGAGKTLEPLAKQYGVDGRVHELPERVPYFTALQLLRDADLLLLPGSTSPGYTASKLYPYILSRRPILAVFNESSSVSGILRATCAGELVSFGNYARPGDARLRERLVESWTRMMQRLPFSPDTDWKAFEPYTAREMTRRQAEVFDAVLSRAHARRRPRR